jgi:acetylornithine deacetylase
MPATSEAILKTPIVIINKVLKGVEDLGDRIVSLSAELIRIPSINPRYPGMDYQKEVGGETNCNRRLAEVYREIGCKVEFIEK